MTFALSIMTVLGQNRLKGGNYFLLLKDKEKISLNTYENNKIKEKGTFTISEKSIFTTDQKERVAILDTAKNLITLYDFQTSKEIRLSIPYDIKPKCILLNDDDLFIGGKMGKEILVQYHIQSEKWYELEIPTQVIFGGKAIDDLVVNDSLLIAIDNVVMPKYILFYRLNTTEKLAFSHFKLLKSNGTWEHIFQGRITSDYLGLRSSTFWSVGSAQHITIYKNLDLTECFAISVSNGSRKNETNEYNDFLIVGNKVVIANKENGLGLFEIKKSYFEPIKNYVTSYSPINNFKPIKTLEFRHVVINDSKISYEKYKNKNIIKLTQIPNTKKIILTIENNNIRHEIIEI